jgi:hypothetical protein
MRRAGCLAGAYRSLSRRLFAFGAEARGVAALEFAVIAPLLITTAVATVDIGCGFYSYMQVQNAAQAGANYAWRHGFAANGISQAVLSATDSPGLVVSPAPAQSCGCPSDTGVAWGDCGAVCAGGGVPGTYVTVGAQASYTPMLPYPGLPRPVTLTAQTVLRIR